MTDRPVCERKLAYVAPFIAAAGNPDWHGGQF